MRNMGRFKLCFCIMTTERIILQFLEEMIAIWEENRKKKESSMERGIELLEWSNYGLA